MIRAGRFAVGLSVLWLGRCAVPPPDAYYTGSSARTLATAFDLGRNTVGEACVQGSGAEIYCGAWRQPSAYVREAGPADAAGLAELIQGGAGGGARGGAGGGAWRRALDSRYLCAAPNPVSLGGLDALRMDCTGRTGGWPYVALVAVANGRGWLADGVVSAVPAMVQSIAIQSGRAPAKMVSSAAVQAQQAARAGEQALDTGDSRQYDELMSQGARANLLDDPVAAESAYAGALAVQERGLGRDNPNLADPLMHLGLQLSNQGRFAEADAMFARAGRLISGGASGGPSGAQGDATIAIRLLYYRALDDLNRGELADSLARLQRAEAGYLATIDPTMLMAHRQSSQRGLLTDFESVVATPEDQQNRLGLLGLLEVKRYEAVVLRDLHRLPESEAKLGEAAELSRKAHLAQPLVTARLRRTAAISAEAAGQDVDALAAFGSSVSDFRLAYPGSRPLALAELLNAAQLMKVPRPAEAVEVCRMAVQVLIEVKAGYSAERLSPCLRAYATLAASASDAARQQVLSDMFLAAQLVRNSVTEQQINQAAARLGAGGHDSGVAAAIRRQQDAAVALSAIRRREQAAAEAARSGGPTPLGTAELAEQERVARAALADADGALQAAAPNYAQLVQQVTPAADIINVLPQDEAFVSIVMAGEDVWVFLLRNKTIQLSAVTGGAPVVDKLVARIRVAMVPQPPPFDIAAAQELYARLFGPFAAALTDAKYLTVAPTGSLLSLPFGVLLSGPAEPTGLATAPWLIRQMAIGHVPSAENFVALRRVAGVSHASRPWFGLGDFHPVSLAQAQHSFGPQCGASAQRLSQIPPLPSATLELSIAAKLLGATAGDELLGAAFNAPAVARANLADYRVLHFATHAILPSELPCQNEPAIVTSPAPGAVDASSALLTASDLTQIKLDANLVILSACNSGGAEGSSGGGESLSALARSFFYGGARSLLITHWEVDDQVATFIIADTLRGMQQAPDGSVAADLQHAQLDLLDRAGHALPAEFAHPFYWAPFALIGQAGIALPVLPH